MKKSISRRIRILNCDTRGNIPGFQELRMKLHWLGCLLYYLKKNENKNAKFFIYLGT